MVGGDWRMSVGAWEERGSLLRSTPGRASRAGHGLAGFLEELSERGR